MKFLFGYIVIGSVYLIVRGIFFPDSIREGFIRARDRIHGQNSPDRAEIIFKLTFRASIIAMIMLWPAYAFEAIVKKVTKFFNSLKS